MSKYPLFTLKRLGWPQSQQRALLFTTHTIVTQSRFSVRPKAYSVCYFMLHQAVMLKMCKVIQWRGVQRYKEHGASLCTKNSFQLPAVLSAKTPVPAASWDHHRSAPWLSFLMRFARSLIVKAPLHSHPNGYRAPALTLENSKGMLPPIHPQAVLDSKHSYT